MHNEPMSHETHIRQNRVLAPIVLALSIILGVFLLRPFYTNTIEQSVITDRVQSTLEGKTDTYNSLLKVQELLNSGTTSDLSKKVAQLNQGFNVSDIMGSVMLNDYTKSTLSANAPIAIGSISVSK